jgi:hypothetical protein
MNDYSTNARHRASRRKSPWNLLLLVFVIAFIVLYWVLFFKAAGLYFQFLHKPSFDSHQRSEASRIVIVLGAFFTSMPLGMLTANFLVWCIPPARRALEAEAAAFPGTEYSSAQRFQWSASKLLVRIYRRLLGL